MQSFQQKIKRCDYSRWKHWTIRNTRCWAKSIMQSMRTLFTRWYDREQEVHQVRAGFVLHPKLLHKEGPATVTDTGRKKVAENSTQQNRFKRGVERNIMKTFMIDFVRDTTFRKTMIELDRSENVILEMDRLASEDHSHTATEEEIDLYRGNWCIHSNVANFDSVPTRHRPDFKKALSTLYRLKKTEDNAHDEKWSHNSSSWWQWQTSWWHPYYETSPRGWA